ncbi:MAG: T9SS type A sorting domain-containing protein, partial [Chitinophagales bacterium]
FTAPQNCFTPLCAIDTIIMSNQSICDFNTNTYSQEIIVTYPNTSTGQININGQLFASTGTPQTITLQNLTANGQGVNVTAYFVNNSTCVVSIPNAFTAPQDCYISECPIDDIIISNQSICDEMTNTYSQELILYYDDEPNTGEIDVNGQLFTITSSPQTITLTNLQATGEMTDIFAQFTFNPTNCIYVVSDAYASPNSCGSVGIQHQFIEGTQVYSYDNTIVVDLSETIIDGITQVDIFSIIGQLIEQGDIDNNNRVQYQLNNQATGHYIVRLVNDDKHASYKVFIER